MQRQSESKKQASALHWLVIIGVMAAVIGALYYPLFAKAQPHDVHDPAHWYPIECCHAMDCAPVDSAAIANPVESGGLPNMVVTSKHGTVVVPHSFPRRQSKDHRMHVCMRPAESGQMRLICIFDAPGI